MLDIVEVGQRCWMRGAGRPLVGGLPDLYDGNTLRFQGDAPRAHGGIVTGLSTHLRNQRAISLPSGARGTVAITWLDYPVADGAGGADRAPCRLKAAGGGISQRRAHCAGLSLPIGSLGVRRLGLEASPYLVVRGPASARVELHQRTAEPGARLRRAQDGSGGAYVLKAVLQSRLGFQDAAGTPHASGHRPTSSCACREPGPRHAFAVMERSPTIARTVLARSRRVGAPARADNISLSPPPLRSSTRSRSWSSANSWLRLYLVDQPDIVNRHSTAMARADRRTRR